MQTQLQQWQSERKALKQQLQQLRSQSDEAQTRLEETAWSLCNRNGEMALLKSQLKDAHVSHATARWNEPMFFLKLVLYIFLFQ